MTADVHQYASTEPKPSLKKKKQKRKSRIAAPSDTTKALTDLSDGPVSPELTSKTWQYFVMPSLLVSKRLIDQTLSVFIELAILGCLLNL